MKRTIAFSLVLLVILSMLPVMVNADHGIHIFVNGTRLDPDIPPKIIDSYTFVPVRIVAEQLGAGVSWSKADRKVTVINDRTNIELLIDSKEATINGSKVELPVAPLIIEGITMLPLRYIGDQLGVKVSWDALTKSVFVYKKEEQVTIQSASFTDQAVQTDQTDDEFYHKSEDLFGDNQVESDPSLLPDTETNPVGNESLNQLAAVGSIESVGEQIMIQSDSSIQPNVFYLPAPDRIVLDLPRASFGSTLNGEAPMQNGEIASHHPLINKIRYAQFSNDPSTIRIVLDLKQPVKYEVFQNDQTNQISLFIKSTVFKIVLDAGHGGHDPGATGVSNKFEKGFTLSLTSKVHKLLEKEPLIKSYMTRSDDTFISLEERAKQANELEANLFISIHGNTYESGQIRGTETYYSRPESYPFAELIHRHLLEATGLPDRKVKKVPFKVIRETKMPAVLLEVGYLSNKQDEAQMLQDDFQNRVAASIVKAIKEQMEK